jgi:hypothetical protein
MAFVEGGDNIGAVYRSVSRAPRLRYSAARILFCTSSVWRWGCMANLKGMRVVLTCIVAAARVATWWRGLDVGLLPD